MLTLSSAARPRADGSAPRSPAGDGPRELHPDGTVAPGPPEGSAASRDPGDDLSVGHAEARAARRHRDREIGGHRREKRRQRRGAAAVMGQLQHLTVEFGPARQQCHLPWCLEIAGKEQAHAVDFDPNHQRAVVARAVEFRRRPEGRHPQRSQLECCIAGSLLRHAHTPACRHGTQARKPGIHRCAERQPQCVHGHRFEQRTDATTVIEIGVAHDDQLQPLHRLSESSLMAQSP